MNKLIKKFVIWRKAIKQSKYFNKFYCLKSKCNNNKIFNQNKILIKTNLTKYRSLLMMTPFIGIYFKLMNLMKYLN